MGQIVEWLIRTQVRHIVHLNLHVFIIFHLLLTASGNAMVSGVLPYTEYIFRLIVYRIQMGRSLYTLKYLTFKLTWLLMAFTVIQDCDRVKSNWRSLKSQSVSLLEVEGGGVGRENDGDGLRQRKKKLGHSNAWPGTASCYIRSFFLCLLLL